MSAYDLVLWISGESAKDWREWSIRAAPASFGPGRCRVYTSVVDDSVLDVHVSPTSVADAERVKQLVKGHCRHSAHATLEGSWLLAIPDSSLAPHGATRRPT